MPTEADALDPEPVRVVESAEESSEVTPAALSTAAETDTGSTIFSARTTGEEQPTEKATATLAAAATPTRSHPPLVNLIGSVVLNLLTGLIHLIDGPPVLPPGSTVTVHTSSLTLPIGAGRKVQADWYFPEEVDESTRFVYLQHGFLASGPMYSYTAAQLAERSNSIVVAPSLSSNFFNLNAEWVGGSTMQEAVAELFLGDRAALTESASVAAGYSVTLPQTFVLVGHSAGGTLVTAAAGYLADMDATGDLAGIVMLDGVEPNGSHAVNDALEKLTGEHLVPIYLISSQRYMWSRDGDMADKLMAARPTEFNGVALAEGMHIDYMEGGNTLLQFAEYLITGFSHPENIDAAALITAGWVNDLFAGATADGIYGAPGQSIPIDTPSGQATAVVLPLGPADGSPLGPILDPLLTAVFEFAGQHLFVYEPLSGNGAYAPGTAATARPATTEQLTAAQPWSVAERVGAAIGHTVNLIGTAVTSVVNAVGSTVFDVLGAAIRAIDGPPVLPPESTVTVHSSRLQITEDLSVEANWYYPATEDPPVRLVLLQHGFLATGPMYSYTAAKLAEQSHSIVVTPSLPSNPFAADGVWLGGYGMERAVADLFVGDRDALNRSAAAAGYAEVYGLDPGSAVLPRSFAMAGHSLGGSLVSGAAGYLVDNGAVVDLVGVITLDGVPPGDSLPNALEKLTEYEEREDGHYIPVREIGAGSGLLAGISQRDAAFEARPDRYNGVVLVDGVHMDAMQGGNPVIQFLGYLVAGFPQEQNQAAVQHLMDAWLDEWFAGQTGVGDELEPGATITIDTSEGPAYGVVIGEAVAASLTV